MQRAVELLGSPEGAIAFLKYLTQKVSQQSGDPELFDATALSGLRNFNAEPGRITCEMPVTSTVQNRFGTLHGGCIATLVDTVGTMALATVSPRLGVSLNINVDYLNAMPAGGVVAVDAKVVKVGQSIATINVEVWDKDSGKLIAQGTHVKFLPGEERRGSSNGGQASTASGGGTAPRSKL